MTKRQCVCTTIAVCMVAIVAGSVKVLSQEPATRIVKGDKIKVTHEVTYLGKSEGKEQTREGKSVEELFATATVYLINARGDRLVRGYIINEGVVHTLQAAIGRTCPGDSDAQIAACAAQGRYVPLGANFPAGTPINVDLVSTRPGDDSTMYIQRVIRNETLSAGSRNVVAFVP